MAPGTPPGDENGQISTVHSHPPSSSSPTSSSEGGQVANANAPSGSSRTKRSNSEKGPRVRTVLSEQQLQTLRTVYASNPRPDALLKEHLVEITGLSPRVIRVWFQNKRCKDKKKAIQAEAMRLQQQQGVQKVSSSSACGAGLAMTLSPLVLAAGDATFDPTDSTHSRQHGPDFPSPWHICLHLSNCASLLRPPHHPHSSWGLSHCHLPPEPGVGVANGNHHVAF